MRDEPELTEAEFLRLGEFLLSGRLPEEALSLIELDGFLTAIVIGPELVKPSEWLPVVWGGDSPGFKDLREARAILGLVMRLYNEVGRQFADDESNSFDPVLDVDMVDEWCSGFHLGVQLQPLWDSPEGREQTGEMMFPILTLGTQQGWDLLQKADDSDALIQETIDLVVPAVRALHAHWLKYRRAGVGGPVIRSAPRTGRNDPCPCGSGRKFKRCCGDPALGHA